jgi:hypothetical protein
MNGSAPIMKVILSMQPILDGKCIQVFTSKDSQIQLIRAIGILTDNAIDIIAWLNILINKSPVMVPNYIHMGSMCTMYLFDPRHINLKMLKIHLAGALGINTDEEVAAFATSLY